MTKEEVEKMIHDLYAADMAGAALMVEELYGTIIQKNEEITDLKGDIAYLRQDNDDLDKEAVKCLDRIDELEAKLVESSK